MSCFGASAHESATKPVVATLVIHGGSGHFTPVEYPPELVREHKEALKVALLLGNKILSDGGSALDAVVAAVQSMEDDPLFNAGKGAVFDISGGHELEATVAVSSPPIETSLPASRRGAAVTLLKHVKNPILLAKELYLDENACPHAFVSGVDAERIAREKGLEIVENRYFDTEPRWKEHRGELGLPARPYPPVAASDSLPRYGDAVRGASAELILPKGTVGAVALDSHGNLACATSTGGKTNKNVGRIGDTPSMDSGFYCAKWTPAAPSSNVLSRLLTGKSGDSEETQGVAISGTGEGDYFIRNVAAYDVVARMKYLGEGVQEASVKVLGDLKTQGGQGGMICVDAHGTISTPNNSTGMFRGTITANEGIARVACWTDEQLEQA